MNTACMQRHQLFDRRFPLEAKLNIKVAERCHLISVWTIRDPESQAQELSCVTYHFAGLQYLTVWYVYKHWVL